MRSGKSRKKAVKASVDQHRAPRRRWRDYKTPSGRSPVEEFIDELSDLDAAAVLAGMQEVRGACTRRGTWTVRSGRCGSTETA
jgi:hypothetical protein